ncbi:MAG: hypothetical protein FD163_572 [Hyphomonadaceae bacterium]|nr:MAG: hypothetical protein FD128_1387 [Hyphomonadaceae bacterium]KAF0185904.1 MAG: hypothetical protein FD163_572 [Hyphomonadaceae bacterium]
MDENGSNIFAQIASANLNLSEVQNTNTPVNKPTKISVFEPISIVDQIYGCAFSPENAKQYLQKIKEHFGADGVLLAISNRADQSLCFQCAIGEVEYLQPTIQNNPSRLLHCKASNQVLIGSLILFIGGQSDDFDDAAKHEFELLQPHFTRSLDISAYLNFADYSAEKLTKLIEAIEAPLGIANKEGEILAINRVGLSFLKLHCEKDFEKDGFWIGACNQTVLNGEMTYDFLINGEKFVARLNCLASEFLETSSAKIMINFQRAQAENSRNFSKFKLAYGLTQAELEILEQLNEGHSASKIAQIRSSSRDTVRGQLRTIMEKTNTKSQIDLIALVRNK